MTDAPLVALVVPVHNNKEDTREFLESLKQVTYPNYEIIIIDDGSTDGTDEMLKEEYPYVIVLKGDGSLFWARAFNMGVEAARNRGAKYILSIDNDMVVHPQFLSALVDTAERNPKSIVCGKCYYYYERERIWEAGGTMTWTGGGFRKRGYDQIDRGQYDLESDVQCATIGVLINTSIFDNIGVMDSQNFPQYRADVDFTYRAFKRGYRIIYQPKSQIWHKVSRTAGTTLLPRGSRLLSPLSLLIYALSSKSKGTPLNFREFLLLYRRHFPFTFSYIIVYKTFRFLFTLYLGRLGRGRDRHNREVGQTGFQKLK